MRHFLPAFAMGLALFGLPARADDLCGTAPSLSVSQARRVEEARFELMISSAAGEAFARHAADVYRRLAKDRTPEEARMLAVALLHAYCLKLTRGEDPARLPWHFKDHFAGLSKLVPDFREAHALLDRIATAEARR